MASHFTKSRSGFTRILHGMGPFDARPAQFRIDAVAGEDNHGRPVAPGVVNGHGGMLQADRPVAGGGQWLAGCLGITMPHGDCGFFMQAGNEFRALVSTVVDNGFMQAAETGTRV